MAYYKVLNEVWCDFAISHSIFRPSRKTWEVAPLHWQVPD